MNSSRNPEYAVEMATLSAQHHFKDPFEKGVSIQFFLQMLSHLSLYDIARLAQVCKETNYLIMNNTIPRDDIMVCYTPETLKKFTFMISIISALQDQDPTKIENAKKIYGTRLVSEVNKLHEAQNSIDSGCILYYRDKDKIKQDNTEENDDDKTTKSDSKDKIKSQDHSEQNDDNVSTGTNSIEDILEQDKQDNLEQDDDNIESIAEKLTQYISKKTSAEREIAEFISCMFQDEKKKYTNDADLESGIQTTKEDKLVKDTRNGTYAELIEGFKNSKSIKDIETAQEGSQKEISCANCIITSVIASLIGAGTLAGTIGIVGSQCTDVPGAEYNTTDLHGNNITQTGEGSISCPSSASDIYTPLTSVGLPVSFLLFVLACILACKNANAQHKIDNENYDARAEYRNVKSNIIKNSNLLFIGNIKNNVVNVNEDLVNDIDSIDSEKDSCTIM